MVGTDSKMYHKAWAGQAPWYPSQTGWEDLGGTFPGLSRWTPVQSPGGFASAMWLMQDGSVLANLYGGTKLMALHPDSHGSYVNGSWSTPGNLLLERWAFSSAVLSDGRLIVCGGEYSGPGLPETETNSCEIYDPRTQLSTAVTPPQGWTNIGDGPTVVLNDGNQSRPLLICGVSVLASGL